MDKTVCIGCPIFGLVVHAREGVDDVMVRVIFLFHNPSPLLLLFLLNVSTSFVSNGPLA